MSHVPQAGPRHKHYVEKRSVTIGHCSIACNLEPSSHINTVLEGSLIPSSPPLRPERRSSSRLRRAPGQTKTGKRDEERQNAKRFTRNVRHASPPKRGSRHWTNGSEVIARPGFERQGNGTLVIVSVTQIASPLGVNSVDEHRHASHSHSTLTQLLDAVGQTSPSVLLEHELSPRGICPLCLAHCFNIRPLHHRVRSA